MKCKRCADDAMQIQVTIEAAGGFWQKNMADKMTAPQHVNAYDRHPLIGSAGYVEFIFCANCGHIQHPKKNWPKDEPQTKSAEDRAQELIDNGWVLDNQKPEGGATRNGNQIRIRLRRPGYEKQGHIELADPQAAAFLKASRPKVEQTTREIELEDQNGIYQGWAFLVGGTELHWPTGCAVTVEKIAAFSGNVLVTDDRHYNILATG